GDLVGTYNTMWRNNANGSFSDVTADTGLGGIGLAAIGSDYNNDRAVDLVANTWLFPPTIFENPREGKFAARRPWSQTMPGMAAGLAILDFDHDGWMDIACTHWESPAMTLWRIVKGKSFQQVNLPETNWARAYAVAAFDY